MTKLLVPRSLDFLAKEKSGKVLIEYCLRLCAIARKFAVLSDSRNCHYPSDHLPVLAKIERK